MDIQQPYPITRELLAQWICGDPDAQNEANHTYLNLGGLESVCKRQWHDVMQIADQEGVAPLLFNNLKRTGSFAILPAPMQDALARSYYHSAAHNIILFTELQRVLKGLQEVGIPAIVLKGAAFAGTVYPDRALRPMGDLDLLIPFLARDHAIQYLKTHLGYVSQSQEVVPHLAHYSDYHTKLIGGVSGGESLEIHWGLVASQESWYAVSAEWFWEHRTLIPIPGSQPGSIMMIETLSPDAHLLYLAAHLVLQHGLNRARLIWLLDIHYLIKSGGFIRNFQRQHQGSSQTLKTPALSWDRIDEYAWELGWSDVLASALEQVQAVLKTPLPAEFLSILHSRPNRRMQRFLALKQFFPPIDLMDDWYTLFSLRWPARLKFSLALIFPTPAYLRWRYRPNPAWLWPLYYFHRWFRLVKVGLTLLGRLLWQVNQFA